MASGPLDGIRILEFTQIIAGPLSCSGYQRMAAPPLKMSDSPTAVQGASPPLGRDTETILAGAGYSPDQIESLRVGGVIV